MVQRHRASRPTTPSSRRERGKGKWSLAWVAGKVPARRRRATHPAGRPSGSWKNVHRVAGRSQSASARRAAAPRSRSSRAMRTSTGRQTGCCSDSRPKPASKVTHVVTLQPDPERVRRRRRRR